MVNTALRFRKLWAGLSRPGYRRALRLGVGASLEHEAALAHCRFDTVIDVGANRGQFSTFARAAFPNCRIVAFEPLDRPAATFEKLFAGDPKTRLVHAALGTARGTVIMHVTEDDDSSSPLAIGEAQRRAFGTVERTQVEVPCGLLADFLRDGDLGAKNLLKIDAQGYELEVLRGAQNLLGRFSAIYCELSFVELYTGQPLASEVITYLGVNGFGLAGVFNIASKADLGQMQADAFFRSLRPSVRAHQTSK